MNKLIIAIALTLVACGPEDQTPVPDPTPTPAPTTITAQRACNDVGNATCARLTACGLTSSVCAPGGVAYACLRDAPQGSVFQSTVNTCTAAIGTMSCASMGSGSFQTPAACSVLP